MNFSTLHKAKKQNLRRSKEAIFGLMLLLTSFISFAQEVDEQSDVVLKKEKTIKHRYFEGHKPTKAMWMSAALPGLGQYYNQKYWKIPIVYTGFSTLAYFSIINRQEYVKYRDAYSIKTTSEIIPDEAIYNYSESQLLSLREYYQSNLELNYILFGAFYLLQIIDATVDAHFYDYDINDNLTIGIDPILYQNQNQFQATPGFKVRWTFGKP
ncbi:MAG: hypothetical protein JW729_06230 [Bacteroidales bacterium]|nr:hypothetical protein [Bacteroidales bacterium]